jgi:hypothetical protein
MCRLAWYQNRGLGFKFLWSHAFSFVACNNSHLPWCSLSTYIAQACYRDSHAWGVMLDYSISGPLTPFISPGLYGWTDWEGESSSMVAKLRYLIQFLPVTHFLSQDSHAWGIMLDYNIIYLITPSISPSLYSWTGWEGESSSMVAESRSLVQFLPVTYILPLRIIIHTYRAVRWVRIWPERTAATRT